MVPFGTVVSEEKTFKESPIESSLFPYFANLQANYNCEEKPVTCV